jgi:hypothetical protein
VTAWAPIGWPWPHRGPPPAPGPPRCGRRWQHRSPAPGPWWRAGRPARPRVNLAMAARGRDARDARESGCDCDR